MFTGVDNVSDYPKINKILISYGYEADISVLGYNSQGVIFLIPTGSSPSILDGTLAHAGEFTKLGIGFTSSIRVLELHQQVTV